MGKAKLDRKGMLLDCLLLTPTRSFNASNTYSPIEISKWSFLSGTESVLDLEVFHETEGVVLIFMS